ncbi:uncharacterized protein PRCAT00004121001 [Priceomyces carsonii]|uniref:uncharacterized protein n=1 Tax=Priceomyces carsonii TaxID=28549 RepID=UPI002ED81CFE|nr:unnamed protein product [Priceomyces carsonii]
MSRDIVKIISPAEFRTLFKSSSPQKRVIALDSTCYLPNSPKDGLAQFLNEDRLPNASYIDIDVLALPGSKYPHMLPTASIFKKVISEMGILKTDRLVLYDRTPNFSSPRAAWSLLLFGHKEVYLLDNYVKYKQEGYPIDNSKISSPPKLSTGADYETIPEEQIIKRYHDQVITFEELLSLVESGNLAKDYYFFDARTHERFTGKGPEPRPELSSGHIESSLNLPAGQVLNADRTFKLKKELLELFKTRFDLDLSKPDLNGKKGIIVLCGTGVTAVILKLAIESVIGADVPIRVYDGSWTEWTQRAPAKYIVKDA